MIKNCGNLFRNIEGERKWRILGFYNAYRLGQSARLPVDLLAECYNYCRIPIIKTEIIIDDDSFKYLFLDENKSTIISIRRPINNMSLPCHIPKSQIRSNRFYSGKYNYETKNVLENFVNSKSLMATACDFLIELHINQNYKNTIRNLYLEDIYDHRDQYYKRYFRNFQRAKTFLTPSEMLDISWIRYNSNWNLLELMGKNSKKINKNKIYHECNFQFEIFVAANGITQYASVKDIFQFRTLLYNGRYKQYSHSCIANKKHIIEKHVDYTTKNNIEFEDPKYVNKKYKNKYTLFIKIESIPRLLCECSEYEFKLLGIWVIKCLTEC